ncbi:hypothetical protein REPUB_Repub13aG0036000 [Reevesia pubescens]
MGFLSLFIAALMPVLKVILMTVVGLLVALDRINLLGPEANHHLNNIVFYVVSPALAASSLAESITIKSFITLWFMPVNLLLTFVIGSILAWLLIKITRTPKHLQGIIIGCCSAGNTGNLPLIMIPAVCEEPSNPFGDPSLCSANARPYASLSLSIGAIYIWSYAYGIMRLYANKGMQNGSTSASETVPGNSTELAILPSTDSHPIQIRPTSSRQTSTKISVSKKIMQRVKIISGKVDLKKVFAPTAIAARGNSSMHDLGNGGKPYERFKKIRYKSGCDYRDNSSEEHIVASGGNRSCQSCTPFWDGWIRFFISVCSYASICCSSCNGYRYNNPVFSAWSS